MKYNIFFFILFSSCINNSYTSKNSVIYTAKGFAHINNQSVENLNSDKLFVSHNKIRLGKKIQISNPVNRKSVEAIVKNKKVYDNFYKVSISNEIAVMLGLDLTFPYVEISEIKKNESFIAKKTITENIEKKIANKAPIEKININNLRKKKKLQSKVRTYSILVAKFYSLESASFLKKKLETILENSNYQLIYVNKINNKSYELLMGPYNTINKLKNDYSVLVDSNFEDLDIKIND